MILETPMKHFRKITFIVLAGCLLLVIGKKQLGSDALPKNLGARYSNPRSAESPTHNERMARQRRCAAYFEAANRSYQVLLETPKDDHAQRKLLQDLAIWAGEDLNGVRRWIQENDGALPKNRRWLGDVLVELAKTNPRKALEFGLSLNEANTMTYDVPPRSLLGIALQHLTAEDAIRVMAMPNHDAGYARTLSESSPGETYHPDFNFKKLGDYLVLKEHEGEIHSWKPTTYPADFLANWARRDALTAKEYCRAMNDRPEGAITGLEYLEYYSEVVKVQKREQVIEEIAKDLTNPGLSISEGHLAYRWISDPTTRPILLDVAARLPYAIRDRMGEDALLMHSLSKTEDNIKICEAAMRLFSSPAARDGVVDLCIRVHPETGPMLKELQEKVYGGNPHP